MSTGAKTFGTLCHLLQDRAHALTRRTGDPWAIRREARDDIIAHLETIEPTFANVELVPEFLRNCSTLYRIGGLPAVAAQRIATLCDATTDTTLDYNVLCNVAFSCLTLQNGSALTNVQDPPHHRGSAGNNTARSTPSSASHSLIDIGDAPTAAPLAPAFLVFPPVIKAAYDKAVTRLHTKSVAKPHTDTTIQLLKVSHDIYHHKNFASCVSSNGHRRHTTPFVFHPVGAEMHSLLPVKSKVQLEAKLMRTGEARDILKTLRRLRLSRVDAGMLMGIMAECGLYDEEVANDCGGALSDSISLLSSEQVAHALFSYGVLNHRHPQLRYLASRFDASSGVTTEGMRRYALGLACLQFPLAQKRQLVDWIFMHAMRFQENDPKAPRPSWYVDCVFALACLGVKSHKFSLMTARRSRRGLGDLPLQHKLRLLYALGAVRNEKVSPHLEESWGKVGKTMDIITEVLKTNVTIQDAPIVAAALISCGYRDHPLVPKVDIHHQQLNPVQQILTAWTTSQRESKRSDPRAPTVVHSTKPKDGALMNREQALHLAEQIRPHHFSDASVGADITHVFQTLAFDVRCRVEGDADQQRFQSLCETVETQLYHLSLDDAALVFRAMQHIGLLDAPRHKRCRDLLLEKFWSERYSMSAHVQNSLFDAMEGIEQVDRVVDLTEYIAGQRCEGDDQAEAKTDGPRTHSPDEY
jgi:hypothetical protein